MPSSDAGTATPVISRMSFKCLPALRRLGKLGVLLEDENTFNISYGDLRRVCMCIYICVYIYICMYVCMYVCMYICIYVYMYICIYVHMYICMIERLLGSI